MSTSSEKVASMFPATGLLSTDFDATIWSSSQGMRHSLSPLVASFEQDGFAVFRDVFTAQEIAEMRRRIELQVELDRAQGKFEQAFFDAMGVKTGQGDLISKVHLRDYLLDDRILAIARALLPEKPLTYFGESTYQLGSSGRIFHRDNVDRDKAAGPDWDGPYPLLRMGIYLQDHRRHSGGLKIKAGSHLRNDGPSFLVDSNAGDVVVWNMRTLHSGNAVRLRLLPNFAAIPPSSRLRKLKIGEDMIPQWMQQPLQRERAAMFMSFGVESKHLDRYQNEFLKAHDTASEQTIRFRFGDELWETLQRKQLSVSRLHPENASNWRALKQ
jgi:Phytanoyl-CoA dioxygenase (PhyH)